VTKKYWQDDAACLGEPLSVFFPEGTTDKKWQRAIAICQQCTVQKQCLDLVIGLDELSDRYGVFGGLTPYQRMLERDRRNGIVRTVKLKGSVS
jgi:hypothetical protein